MSSKDVIIVEKSQVQLAREAEAELDRLENIAANAFRASEKALKDGVKALWHIRESNLWEYARDDDDVRLKDKEHGSWSEYLRLLVRRKNISRSGLYDHLGTVDVWVKALKREIDELDQLPSMSVAGYIKEVIDYDGRSKEVRLPPPEVIERLPPPASDVVGKDPEEVIISRVNALVDEAFIQPAVPLTKTDIRKMLRTDVGGDPDIQFFESGKGEVWGQIEGNGTVWDGVVIPAEQYAGIPEALRKHIAKKLNILPYEKGGNNG